MGYHSWTSEDVIPHDLPHFRRRQHSGPCAAPRRQALPRRSASRHVIMFLTPVRTDRIRHFPGARDERGDQRRHGDTKALRLLACPRGQLGRHLGDMGMGRLTPQPAPAGFGPFAEAGGKRGARNARRHLSFHRCFGSTYAQSRTGIGRPFGLGD